MTSIKLYDIKVESVSFDKYLDEEEIFDNSTKYCLGLQPVKFAKVFRNLLKEYQKRKRINLNCSHSFTITDQFNKVIFRLDSELDNEDYLIDPRKAFTSLLDNLF